MRGKMQSPCINDASQACFNGCYSYCSLGDGESRTKSPKSTITSPRIDYDFAIATASSLPPNIQFNNPESLPSLKDSFLCFTQAYPQYSHTFKADQIRAQEYSHLDISRHVCFDYIGHGLLSYAQQQQGYNYYQATSIASSSSAPPPLSSPVLEPPFFDISYKPVNLNYQILYGSHESKSESSLCRRIMEFMNISEADYSLVFTANQSSAFKLVAESYQFQNYQKLLTVYDFRGESQEVIIEIAKKQGAQVLSAEFMLPNFAIRSRKLQRILRSKKNNKQNKGLFVFPVQSSITGGRYSHLWMALARENGWHVLLDACALGPKEMGTLGLSLFKPDFLICSFYKIFGTNPSGFGCLFVMKTSVSALKSSSNITNISVVTFFPASTESSFPEESGIGDTESSNFEKKALSLSELMELERPIKSLQYEKKIENVKERSEMIKCGGLDHAESLGLTLISIRTRHLINWLVNALVTLKHPNSEDGHSLVRIYGPKVSYHRGPAVAFNIFDWKGEKVDPALVQKLADRNKISLGCGLLQNIWVPDKCKEEMKVVSEIGVPEVKEMSVPKKTRKNDVRISVVTASLCFLTNFEDIYRLWAFVSRFLDADFVERERWRYMALNQETIEV